MAPQINPLNNKIKRDLSACDFHFCHQMLNGNGKLLKDLEQVPPGTYSSTGH